MLFLASCSLVAMENPRYHPPFKRNPGQIITRNYRQESQAPVKAQDLDYLSKLSKFESELNALVDNAKNYHEANQHLQKTMKENKDIIHQDKLDLFKLIEKKLDEKFFPQRNTAPKQLPPAPRR